jgi:hypothetical protein
MKFNTNGVFSVAAGSLLRTTFSEKNAIQNTGHQGSGIQDPPQYKRSENQRTDTSSEEMLVPDGMRAGRRNARRDSPYTRPVRPNPRSPPISTATLYSANEFMACKLFDQMRTMLPGDPSILDFNVNGQPYQMKAFSGGTFMIDSMNPPGLFFSLLIGQGDSARGAERFPGGQEQLATFLTAASAKMQYLAS